MLKFFIQLLTMTKHMVDDILPDLLLLLDKPTIESVFRHCDEFDGSLHVFQKLCGVIARRNILSAPKQPSIQNHEQTEFVANTHACLSDDKHGSNESPFEKRAEPISESNNVAHIGSKLEPDNDDDDDDCVWKALITEVTKGFCSKKETTEFYYCGLCNVRCLSKNIWDKHVQGKRHVARCDIVASHNMHCETCGFNILSDVQHISLILESPEHRLIDETITREKRACETSKSVQKSVQSTPPKTEPKSENQNTSKVCNKVVMFKGKTVSPNFAQLISQVIKRIENRKEFIACYCRPCDVIGKSKGSWLDHISSPKHVSLMKNKAFNNVLCMCIQCDFGILASKAIAVCYMCYHIEQCHNQSTDDIIHEEYMTIKELTPKVEKRGQNNSSGGSSKHSSFKGSTESMHLSRRSSVNDEPSTRAVSVSYQEMPKRNDEQRKIPDVNKGYSGNSSSRPSSTAQVKSVEDTGKPSHNPSTHGRANLKGKSVPAKRSGGFEEGSLLKYLDDISAPLKEGRSISAMASQGPSRSSSRASLRGSRESVNRSGDYSSNKNSVSRVRSPLSVRDGKAESYGDDLIRTIKPSSARSFPPENPYRPPTPQESSQFLVSGDNDLIAPFLVLLRHKEMKFRENPSFKLFAGLCLLCPSKTFYDAFEWCDHISTHSSSDSQNEVQCSFCNTHLYGNVEEINRVLIPHDEHSRINRLMYSA